MGTFGVFGDGGISGRYTWNLSCVRGNKYYSLMKAITKEKGAEYNVGIEKTNINSVLIYVGIAPYWVVSSDDFDSIIVTKDDKIRSYGGQLEFYPMKQVGYCIRGYDEGVSFGYYDDASGEKEIEWYKDKNFQIVDESGNIIEFPNFEKGKTYTLKWDEDDGQHHEISMQANSRLYSADGDQIYFRGSHNEGRWDYWEYDLSEFEAGLYYISVPQGTWAGGIMSVH